MKIKKILAVLLAFVTIFCTATPALAGDSGNAILDASIDGSGSVVLSVPAAGDGGSGSGNLSDSVSYVLQKYKTIGTAVFGICTITAIICLLWQITKLGMAGDNERNRSMAVKGIFISGAALAIFGSITLVAGMFWGAFL
ncbi:MAG: hypothetical protein K2O18_20020 [Oscillospiraceae bacterium]|nr:hypothetical protein [Oscillospiraceae bacterium]